MADLLSLGTFTYWSSENDLTFGSIYGTMARKLQKISVSKIDKIIQNALTAPQNLRFRELCTLCEHFGMKLRKGSGGHRIYKRESPPMFTLSIQDDGGKAKPYQVRQVLDKVREHGLYDFQEEE